MTSINDKPTQQIKKVMKKVVIFGYLCGGLLLTSLTGCDQAARIGIGTTPINQVLREPAKYQQTVIVRGQVVNQLGILGQGGYELKDDSGSIWVFTRSGIPTINSTVTIKGRVIEGVSIAGQNFAVTITEEQRF
jgi:hypothetical protein